MMKLERLSLTNKIYIKHRFMYTAFLTLFILAIGVFSGCAKSEHPKKVLATVNGEPIYLDDFRRELVLRVRQNPSFRITSGALDEILDIMVDKKLIIQEATKRRLAEEQKFINTIKAFWEQTLVRDFIDYKNSENEDLIYVTDEEIKGYYEKLKTKTTFNIAKREKRQEIEELMEKAKREENVEWDTTVSFSYGEIPSDVLSKAFDLAEGRMGIFEDIDAYYLIHAADKESISVPPLEELYLQIKKKIKERKQMGAFKDWMEQTRKKADVKINKDLLGEVNR